MNYLGPYIIAAVLPSVLWSVICLLDGYVGFRTFFCGLIITAIGGAFIAIPAALYAG